jgi:hypothetical protein
MLSVWSPLLTTSVKEGSGLLASISLAGLLRYLVNDQGKDSFATRARRRPMSDVIPNRQRWRIRA